MLISELVKKTGIPKETIRFYEREGLIKVTLEERRKNNYKEYSNETLEKLKVIKTLKDLGFTLSEVAEIVNLIDVNGAPDNNVSHKISEKINLIDRKIKAITDVRILLLERMKSHKNVLAVAEAIIDKKSPARMQG